MNINFAFHQIRAQFKQYQFRVFPLTIFSMLNGDSIPSNRSLILNYSSNLTSNRFSKRNRTFEFLIKTTLEKHFFFLFSFCFAECLPSTLSLKADEYEISSHCPRTKSHLAYLDRSLNDIIWPHNRKWTFLFDFFATISGLVRDDVDIYTSIDSILSWDIVIRSEWKHTHYTYLTS